MDGISRSYNYLNNFRAKGNCLGINHQLSIQSFHFFFKTIVRFILVLSETLSMHTQSEDISSGTFDGKVELQGKKIP